jgi:choline-sulfatase
VQCPDLGRRRGGRVPFARHQVWRAGACPGRGPQRALLLCVLLALACERAVSPAQIPERLLANGRPNLVLIVVDTLRADDTTPYGSAHPTTPELSRWARRGVVFERVLAQSSWTKISMASLFTSLWPRSHGLHEPRDGLAENALTLAEVLRASGYATWGVQTNGWLHASFGFEQGFDRYRFPKGAGEPTLGAASLWPHADRVVEEAGRLLAERDPSQPFFLYLHFMDVHEYAAPPEFKRFGTDARGAYRAAILWVDDAVRRVRLLLEDAGVLDRSLLVLASDHGEAFGEHGVHGHARSVLTAEVRVPLLLRFPFPTPPQRVTSQVRNLDLAPTLLELLSVEVPKGFEGRSLVPLLAGSATEPDRPAFAALGTPLFADAAVQQALHDGHFTYARNAPEPPGVRPGAELLFDRLVDPDENVDLAALEPARRDALRAQLEAHMAGSAAGVRATDVYIDPAIAERLRAMGYLR